MKLCDECLSVHSKDVNARHLKGRCLTVGGLYDLVKKELQTALKLMPNHPGILVSLAKVDVEVGDHELGIAKLTAALHQDPNHEVRKSGRTQALTTSTHTASLKSAYYEQASKGPLS